LFEDEEKTTSKVAEEFGIRCITDPVCNEFGTPLLDDVFGRVRKTAKNEIVAQVNMDIILMDDFLKAIQRIKSILGDKNFFMVGRRSDVDLEGEVDFTDPNWEQKIRDKILKEGKLHGSAGVDYWVFPKNFDFNPPPFIVGRPGMDSWLIFRARSLKVPVIDTTEVVTILHQNHSYPRKKSSFYPIEKERNLKLAGGFSQMATSRDADWILTQKGLEKPPFPRRIFSELTLFKPWRYSVGLKRQIQKYLKMGY